MIRSLSKRHLWHKKWGLLKFIGSKLLIKKFYPVCFYPDNFSNSCFSGAAVLLLITQPLWHQLIFFTIHPGTAISSSDHTSISEPRFRNEDHDTQNAVGNCNLRTVFRCPGDRWNPAKATHRGAFHCLSHLISLLRCLFFLLDSNALIASGTVVCQI